MLETPKIDVHGMTSTQACDMIRYALPSFKNRGYPEVFIVHGNGQGILKRDIRKLALKLSFINKIRRGKPEEGGDGVTVVTFL